MLDQPRFSDLPLRDELLREIEELGYRTPSPIQAQSIAPLVEGRDLLGQAATGTGKTAAFALPLLQRLSERRPQRDPSASDVAHRRLLLPLARTSTTSAAGVSSTEPSTASSRLTPSDRYRFAAPSLMSSRSAIAGTVRSS